MKHCHSIGVNYKVIYGLNSSKKFLESEKVSNDALRLLQLPNKANYDFEKKRVIGKIGFSICLYAKPQRGSYFKIGSISPHPKASSKIFCCTRG